MASLRLTKTSKIVIAIAIVLLSAALGYLVWRLNNESNLGPNDSDAASCPDGCYWNAGASKCVGSGGCIWKCDSGYHVEATKCYRDSDNMYGGYASLECDPCDSGGGDDDGGDTGSCARLYNDDGAVGTRCSGNNCGGQSCGSYTYECGRWCYDPSCGASACGNETPVTYTLTYTANSGGTISGTTPQTVNSGSDGTEVEAKPNAGYKFVSWSDGVTTAKRTDKGVSKNISVTATFETKKYTLKYTAESNGSISGTSTQTVNHGSNGTKVTATPSANYRFASWSDGVTTAERTDLNVTKDITVTAQFTTIGTYSLTYVAGENGTIDGDTSQTVDHGGSGTEVEALPSTGYFFASWSDGVTTAKRTDINVTKDIVATATFSSECGNGVCSSGENANSCPSDCSAVCGDGFCTHNESNNSCPSDCPLVPQTGIFDTTAGKLGGGLVLILVGVFVYLAPNFSLSLYIKNGKMYISNKNTEKRRSIFEKKFK